MTERERTKRIERAQMRVLFKTPFFAPGVAKLPVRFGDEVPTAATNGREIIWNPVWFDSLEDEVLPTVLCHEVCHCLLGHLWRIPGGADFGIWNQATDHAVNLMLKEFSAQVTGRNLSDPFPFPKPHDAYCSDPKFAGMSEEKIYGILAGAPKQKGKGKNPGTGGQPGGPGNGQPGPHSMPGFGDMIKPGQQPGKAASGGQPGQPGHGGGSGDQDKLRAEWDNTAIQSAKMMGQGRGFVPGGFSRYVNGLVSTSVPWYELLRSWLREQAADDWDFSAPCMEYSDSDFILPSLKSEKMGYATFATDTSGSIDNEILAVFQSEKQAFLDNQRPAGLLDMYCDSRIHKVAEYHAGETIGLDAPGGGGTAFSPVFEHVAESGVNCKCLVYLTDLDGSFPEEPPPYPVLWVVWEKDKKAPFGTVIYVEKT